MSYKQKSYIRQFGNKQNFMETNIVEDISHLVEKTNNTSSYKVYTALLTQSGKNAPVATVLENTLGEINFIYENKGAYIIKNNFDINKTTVFMSQGNILSYQTRCFIEFGNLYIRSFDTNSNSDDVLLNTFLEIRVYNK